MASVMASASSGEKSESLSEQEALLKELHTFLNGATKLAKVRSIEVARAAIYLLKTLPAARDGVLEHMYNLFDESVSNYVLKLELDDNGNVASNVASDEKIIQEVHQVLSDFIKQNPEIWSPAISTWSLSLLGFLSSKYADRRVVPHPSNLPEVLQLWMACPPTRTLIDLTTQCLSTLISSNPDTCIDALIETSVQHSPYFDWVVAHIGSCFPMTVITRVLACGLKDFYMHQDVMEEATMGTNKKAPKIASVVGILGHLAAHHDGDIRVAVLTMFNESFCDSASREQLATGPFLLHLAAMSDVLSHVISSEFVKVVTSEVLCTMASQVEKWRSAKIPGTDGMVRLVVHLLLRSDGGSQVIRRLLDIVSPETLGLLAVVREAAGLVLDSVLLEIQRRVYAGVTDIPLLHFLKSHISDLSTYLCSTDNSRASWVYNLLKLICIHGGEQVSIYSIGYLLSNVDGVAVYASALFQDVQLVQPCVLWKTIAHQMAELKSSRVEKPVTLIQNITQLCQMENLQKVSMEAMAPNLEVLAGQISSRNHSYSDAVIELLSISVIPEQMPMTSLFRVSCSAVSYFFDVLSHKSLTFTKKFSLMNIFKCLLIKLCQQSAAQQMTLRMLLEGIIDKKHSCLFENVPVAEHAFTSSRSAHVNLQSENVKYLSSVTLPQGHSSVFHSGVIGSGLRAPRRQPAFPEDETLFNKQIVLDVIACCCRPSWRFPLDEPSNSNPQSLIPGMKIVALLMVELISPDVMFNGLPWPDEEFLKVTIERDLHIKRMFEDNSILWDLLLLVATVHPALCYCSVLLRAIMGVLLSFWGSCQEKFTLNCAKQLQTTLQLINIMAIGQILPPPLSYVDEVIPLITPYETFSLLSDIWQYMHDNVPSPALFSLKDQTCGRVWRDFSSGRAEGNKDLCDKKYVSRLRCVLFANIEKFGPIYAKFFPADRK